MIGCQKGLLRCKIASDEQLEILQVEEHYSNLYVVAVCWCGEDTFIVVTSRPKFSRSKAIPNGEDNYGIATYTLYSADGSNPAAKQAMLG